MKNERGSITLFVLVSMLFFLIIATTAYVSASTKLQGQNDEIARIKASYEQDLSDEALLQLYNKVTKTREWLAGSGTQEDTYKIYTIEDLIEFSRRSNAGEFVEEGTGEARYIYVELMNDLDFKRDSSYAKADRTDFGDVNDDGTVQDLKTELTTGQGFPCIAATETNAFNGTFEGNEHEIRNLWINVEKNNQGLFGFSKGIIQDLKAKGNITCGVCSGGIVGIANGGKINNCQNYCNITCMKSKDEGGGSYSMIGGIVGRVSENNTNITNCYNEGFIYGIKSDVGGICGYLNSRSIIENCCNNGKVKNDDMMCGGIAGAVLFESNIIKCINLKEVEAAGNKSGGISGIVYRNSIISNCYNIGTIKGAGQVGGITGQCGADTGKGNILNCYNMGYIECSSSNKGAITGELFEESDIVNCYFSSTIINVGTSPEEKATAKTESEMKSQSFVDLLNVGQTDAPWTMDTTNINNGYPVLKWQTQ